MLAQLLKEARMQSSLKQKDIAEAIGVSIATLRRWECGDGIPDFEQTKRYAQLLGYSVAHFAEEPQGPDMQQPTSPQTDTGKLLDTLAGRLAAHYPDLAKLIYGDFDEAEIRMMAATLQAIAEMRAKIAGAQPKSQNVDTKVG